MRIPPLTAYRFFGGLTSATFVNLCLQGRALPVELTLVLFFYFLVEVHQPRRSHFYL